MRQICASDIVISTAGHDRGRAYVVMELRGDRARLADGKRKKLANPKFKSLKHIRFGKAGSPEISEALCRSTATDKLIRKELAIARCVLSD